LVRKTTLLQNISGVLISKPTQILYDDTSHCKFAHPKSLVDNKSLFWSILSNLEILTWSFSTPYRYRNACTGPKISRTGRLPDFETIALWKW